MPRNPLTVLVAALALLQLGAVEALLPAAAQEEPQSGSAVAAPAEEPGDSAAEPPAEPPAEPEQGVDQADGGIEEEGAGRETEAVSPESSWVSRVENLSHSILLGEADWSDAEALLEEIDPALQAARQRLREALDSDTEPGTLAARHAEMEDLYDARLLLLGEVRPLLRVQLTGLAAAGVREGRKELDRLLLHMRYQLERAPQRSRGILGDLRTSPVPVVKALFYLILVVLVFRIWRRWAADTLPRMRQSLLAARPRTRRNLRAAKMLWYLDRLRSPLEWLVLLAMIASVLKPTASLQEEEPLWKIIKWVILGWLGLRLADSLAARGRAGLARDNSGLRLRSLKLICGWVVAMGLGRDLAHEYAGQGTLYSWVAWLTLLLGFPVLLVLLHWWEEEIYARLALEPSPPAFVQRLAAKGKGSQGHLGAAAGAFFLMQRGLQRWLLRQLSKTDLGKRAVAQVFRRGVARQAEAQEREDEHPLPLEVREQIIHGEELVEKVHRPYLRTLERLTDEERGRTAAIVGERGAGKSTLLERSAAALGGRLLVIDCPLGGFEALLERVRQELSLPGDGEPDRPALRQALEQRGIRVVAVDNIHRLARPVIGGLADIERFSGLIRELGREVSWIVTLDSAGWQYISRARADTTYLDQVIQLPRWTEKELDELIAKRSSAAGIEPSFDELVLPHQLDEAAYEVEGERNRFAYLRILWDASDGNPGVALRLWCDALRVSDQGGVMVRLFKHGEVADLEGLSSTARFVLRSMVQMEIAELSDLEAALRLQRAEVEAAMRHFLVRGYAEEQEGAYRVAWPWYRSVTRMLARQNLLIAGQ